MDIKRIEGIIGTQITLFALGFQYFLFGGVLFSILIINKSYWMLPIHSIVFVYMLVQTVKSFKFIGKLE